MKPESGYVTTTHFWVRLRSRVKGSSDRLDCVKLLLVDEDLDANEVLDEEEIAEKETDFTDGGKLGERGRLRGTI